MDKNEPTQISSLSEFIEWVNQLGHEKHLFRGVPNAEYKIQASIYRRLREGAGNLEFLQINRDLIADTRLRGHGERDRRELNDLEILAQLQHFGAATCLIDFTRNAQVALYFACQKDNKWEKNSQDSERIPDGKVYVVLNDPLKLKKVTPDLLKEKIDYFLPRFHPYGRDPQLYFWEPGYQNNRIIAQQSIFIFGTYEFDENAACIIEESCKKDILIELEQVSGINQTMLFPDFDGFARLHREEIPYTEPSASDYNKLGDQAYRNAQYQEAIRNYDKAAELDSEDSEIYYWRAAAKRELGQINDAIDDLDKMIEICDGIPHIYELAGKMLLNMKEYRKALIYSEKIIELAPDSSMGYIQRAKTKFELGQYEDAIADYNTILQIDPNDAYTSLMQGKAKEHLGDLEGAKEDFQKALTLEYQIRNAWHVDQIKTDLQRIERRIAERNEQTLY